MSYISPSVQAVIDLFQGPLAEVRFADVDVSTLANLARAAEAAAEELAQHEARVSELKQVLADRQEALLLLAQRGLAYARVYAEADEALTEQLSRINLPKPAKPRKPSLKSASAEPAVTEVSSTSGSDAPAEPSAEHPLVAKPALDESMADEPARDESTADEPAAAPAKSSSKGKRRASASRDEAQTGAE
ncbi:MAG TPA: hypothetical protein VER96_37880 [Polyangiaceae bacterium]|nr:hypothetical protein [Polyangiaceae bacterium]